jgi:hypothetical protein
MERTPIPQELRDSGPLASPAQVSYLKALRDGKTLSSLTQEQVEWLISTDFTTIPKRRASSVIETLVGLPWKPKNEQEAAQVEARGAGLPVSMNDLPDGYYAVKGVEGHKNDISFFRLRSPKQGNWVGYQFTDQVVGHGKRYPVKEAATREKIHGMIKEQGVTECRQLYGQEIGSCGRCGRELTDDTSRARGIGPDCWAIMGG